MRGSLASTSPTASEIERPIGASKASTARHTSSLPGRYSYGAKSRAPLNITHTVPSGLMEISDRSLRLGGSRSSRNPSPPASAVAWEVKTAVISGESAIPNDAAALVTAASACSRNRLRSRISSSGRDCSCPETTSRMRSCSSLGMALGWRSPAQDCVRVVVGIVVSC